MGDDRQRAFTSTDADAKLLFHPLPLRGLRRDRATVLESLRQHTGPLPEDEVRRLLADLDRALTYLHGRSLPIVHRDIKPRNIVRRPNGSYVLVDGRT